MKISPAVLALQSAGVLSYLEYAAASSVPATVSGHTGEYLVPAAIPPPSNVGVEGISTRLLTDTLLSPSDLHSTTQRRVLPWQSSFYGIKPELYYSAGYTPAAQGGQRLLRTYASVPLGESGRGESDIPSTPRSVEETNEFSHMHLPVWRYLRNAEFDGNSQLAEFFQRLPVSAYASSEQTGSPLVGVRLLREEKGGAAAEAQEGRKISQGERTKKEDVQVEKKKKKKKMMMTEDAEATWEEQGQEQQSEEDNKVQKQHEVKAQEEWKAKPYGDIGGEGGQEGERSEGGEEGSTWKELGSAAGDARDGNKSHLDVREPASASTLPKGDGGETGQKFPSPSFPAEDKPYVPAEGADEAERFADEEKGQMPAEEPTKSCVGVCQVKAQMSRRSRWEDAKRQEQGAFGYSPSDKRASGEVPEDTISREKDIKGEAGARQSDLGGQTEAELRLKRSPESVHRERMEGEISNEYPGDPDGMRNLFLKHDFFHRPLRGYLHSPVARIAWYPDYGSIYWSRPYYNYYPVSLYGRWLKEEPSEARKDVGGGGHAPDRRTTSVIPHVYAEGVNRMIGMECFPGSTCSKSLLNTYSLTPSSDDSRLLEHQQSAVGAHHLGTDRRYPFTSVH